jgi:multiple sugar transport system substrate-binding protein
LIFLSLMACSKSEAPVSGNGELSGELKFAFWDSNQEIGLVEQAKAFMQKHPKLKITVEITPWGEYWTKMQVAATGGNMPGVFVMHPDQVEIYAEGGMVMDLSTITANLDMTKFPDYINDDFEVNGKPYGIPKDIGTLGLYYNKDIFDAAGYSYPTRDWTWDDVSKAAVALTDKSKGIYGICAPNNGQSFYWNLVWQNGGDYFDANGRCIMDSPSQIEAMEFAISFIKNGSSPAVQDFTTLSTVQYFSSGKSAMLYDGSWRISQYVSVEGLNFGVSEMPIGKQRGSICSGMAYSVATRSKNPDAAAAFIAWLGTGEAQIIQAETGICIPAYEGAAQPWIDRYTLFDASPFVKAAEYGHVSPGLTTTNDARTVVEEIMPEIYDFKIPVTEGMRQIAVRINEISGK